MARPATSPPFEVIEVIEESRWNPFLAEFTLEHRGAHARLDVIGIEEIGYNVETEDRPFDGVSADTKAGERNVWIIFGNTPENQLTHGIFKVKAIRALRPRGGRGAVLE